MIGAAKNIMIGIFVIIALAVIIFILLFLHPSVGDNARTLRVRFTDIDKITIGTRVSYAGRPVGEVVSIHEIEGARTGRVAQNGDIYVYELLLNVDSGVNVYNTDVIAIRTSGLLGERSVSIMPEPSLPGEDLFLVNNQILYAIPSGSVEETFKQITALSKKFEQVLDNVSDMFGEIKKEQIVAKIAKTVDNANEISEALNQPEKWRQTLDNVWTLSQRAHESLTTLDQSFNNLYDLTNRAHESWTTIDQSLAQFHEASTKANQFTDELNQIAIHTREGKGSIGRLLMDDDIYLRLKSLFGKGETIFNDVNQYGILFHLNKNWQRLNARRARLLERLSTPDQFTHYFNDELNKISSSLSRVSVVLNETTAYYPEGLMDNPEYRRKFADLLRQIGDIEDSLKIYNQQVIDQECH
jgi:phospholipid/cholesterol/gamma-HCH transport system substrate-binding protein